MTKSEIPVRAVLTDYQAGTNIGAHVEKELAACGLEPLRTRLHRLVAFKEMTFTGEVPSTGTAGTQVASLVAEVATLGALPFLTMSAAS